MVLCLLLIRMIRIMVKVARWSRMEEDGEDQTLDNMSYKTYNQFA